MDPKRKSGVAGFDSAFYCGVGCDNDVSKMVRSVVSMETTMGVTMLLSKKPLTLSQTIEL